MAPVSGLGQDGAMATTWGRIFTRYSSKQVRRGKAVIATAQSVHKGAVREVHASCIIALLPPLPCARTTHAILTAFVDFAVG